ncbi:MAG: hypothetical protein ABIX01_10490 [Chitinophagaceae bacterium]
MINLTGLVAVFILIAAACTSIRKKPALLTGDICTIDEGHGLFGVVKVLAIDNDRIHVKMYTNKFYSRPEMIDATTLSMEVTEDDPETPGIPHLPYVKVDFHALKPEVEATEAVYAEELEPYRIWKRS